MSDTNLPAQAWRALVVELHALTKAPRIEVCRLVDSGWLGVGEA